MLKSRSYFKTAISKRRYSDQNWRVRASETICQLIVPFIVTIGANCVIFQPQKTEALPPPEDIPEEILRTEVITEGRSPIDGEPLTAAEYEELMARFRESPYPPELATNIRELIFLLNLRKLFETFTPF